MTVGRYAAAVLPGARRGMTALGLAVLWIRPHKCSDCTNRGVKGPCLHPGKPKVAAMADALDAMVVEGKATRVDGERLGNGGTDSTVWYPS